MEHRFTVQGMTCDHCVRAVTQAVRQIDPQARVDVDLAGGTVVVESTAARASLAEAIGEEGYAVTVTP